MYICTAVQFNIIALFISVELEKAIERITKTALKGKTLKAAVFSLKQAKTSSGDPSSLLLQDMPNGVDEEYLGIVLSKAMKIDENEFSIKYLGSGAALLTFKQCLCDVGKSFKQSSACTHVHVASLIHIGFVCIFIF